jgi:GH15 family glucan-1,4-alpha-glucosidase
MSRQITLSNGNILVAFDEKASLTDFFYPYVGVENHVRGDAHKIGIMCNNSFSWLSDSEWNISSTLQKDTYVAITHCYNDKHSIELIFKDCVYNEKNIFIRDIQVINHSDKEIACKLFFHQVFSIYGTPQEDTAYYDPNKNAIIHYEGRRMFLVYAESSAIPFTDYSIGLYGIEGRVGTFKDAEDGMLSKNPIEHGHVDSVCALDIILHKKETRTVFYWTVVGETKNEIEDLHNYVLYKRPEPLIESTEKFWNAWLKRQNYISCKDDEELLSLFNKSLFYIRGNIDNRGAILASPDSSLLQQGRDTYSYMWPRDGALTVMSLLLVGEYNISKHFFKFCNDVIERDGYLMHKYKADKSLGSSWHSFVKNGVPILPIQEDETALVLIALYQYYEKTKDIDFIEMHYNDVIRKMGIFMSEFIDEQTGLPLPSYDLWEEKHGISTFTASTVYGGLVAASKFASLFQKENDMQLFEGKATRMKKAIVEYLYDKDMKMFVKLINKHGSGYTKDTTLDMSSIYGIYTYGVLPYDDTLVQESIKTIEQHLVLHDGITGVPRYQKDYYFMRADGVSNPWFITTLWLAQYYAVTAKDEKTLSKVTHALKWTYQHASKSGVLSEQLHPYTGEQLSATPLTWSHAEYVRTFIMYEDAKKRLNIC